MAARLSGNGGDSVITITDCLNLIDTIVFVSGTTAACQIETFSLS